MVEYRSAEFESLRFDSSWDLRIYSLSHARDKTKNIFLHFFTKLKTYHLSYSFYKGLIIPLLFSVFSILILVCELHPTALSVHRIHCIRCMRKTKTTRTNNQIKKTNKKINVWIVQCGEDVDTHFCFVLKCNTVAYFAVFITLFGKITHKWNDKARQCSD